ncbi:MAG: sulfotransferase [Desulfobacterales bacterium]|nr:MAG: sulfotransferase [Desulfobacterales bacterium]
MDEDDLYGRFITDRLQAEKTLTALREAIHCYQSGQLSEAEKICDRILEINPRQADALHLSGLIAFQIGDQDKAAARIGQAIEEDPGNAMYYNNLGLAFEKRRQLEKAIPCYQKAVQLDPGSFEAYTNMGNALKAQGNFEAGILCYKKALGVKPDCAEALLNLVDTQELRRPDAKHYLQLAEQIVEQDLSEDDAIRVNFALGKLHHDLGSFDEAFKHYHLANKLKRRKVMFNTQSHRDYVSRIIETFSNDFFAQRQSWGSDSDLPIFIFGMPRSGTTLVEQIIASHPYVFGGGELQFFIQTEQKLSSILETDLDYPECASWIHPETAKNIGEVYVKKARKLTGLSKYHFRITDKNPFNFLHLGLIYLVFPRAHFIHCQRHPLDTCLSVFFHKFTTGNYFAYDLTDLGSYYREYQRLMEHWRKVLPVSICELKYEDLVQHQEEISREVVAFCGLKWDPKCLDFHQSERPVFTGSIWQVRQPMYRTSCGRWQNYDKFLDPLKEVLKALI